MKAKITSIAVFIVLAYVLPLLGNTSLIPTFQVGILVVFVAVLFATQPPLTLTDTRVDKQSDKNSVVLILLGYLIGQVVTVVEWVYFSGYSSWVWDWQTIAGMVLMAGGTIFRVWCIRTLGKFFTATVKTQEKQTVITTGAYKFVRHPSYTGAFLAAIGSSVFLHTYVAVIITFALLSTAYYFRIKAEEETLVNEFGDDYRNYRTRTKKLIPYIF